MRVSYKMLNWAGVMIILSIIALVSIGLIFQPVKNHIPVYDNSGVEQGEVIQVPSLMGGLPESWKEYPEYNIGLGFIAVLSFVGVVLTITTMYSIKEEENDALQSKSGGV